jgi:hypothetical protein
MLITKQTIAEKIGAYLRHKISLSQLVDWAENVMMEGQFDDESIAIAPAVVARIGVADVRAFGLTWEDCEEMLRTLGYDARIEVVPV